MVKIFMQIILSPERLFRYLLIIITVLLAANVIGIATSRIFYHGHIFGLAYIFNFNINTSIPALFEFVIIFFSSLILIAITVKSRTIGERHWIWFSLSILFVVLSLLKIVPLMRIIYFLIHYLKHAITNTSLIIIIIVLASLLTLYIIKSIISFHLKLSSHFRKMFLLSAGIFIFGAIILDQIGNIIGVQYGKQSLIYALMYTIEELMEMLGIAVFIYSLTQYFNDKFGDLSISIK